MKDWKITRSSEVPKRMHLVHCIGNFGHCICNSEEGRWWCPECSEEAPEEIVFCAELARCMSYNDLDIGDYCFVRKLK